MKGVRRQFVLSQHGAQVTDELPFAVQVLVAHEGFLRVKGDHGVDEVDLL